MSVAPPVLTCLGVVKRVGGRPVLRGIDFALRAGETALIRAPRGAGKTTLARLLCGQTVADAGRVLRRGRVAPLVGATHGFQSGAPALRGLDLLAAAYGVDSRAFVHAVAGLMETPEALRRPFSEIVGRDRAILVFAAAWLAPASLYVADGSLLPADPDVRARLAPLFEAARARAGIVWIAEDKAGAGAFAPDRFLRLRGGRLEEEPPDPSISARREAAQETLERSRAAFRAARERFREFERTTLEDLRQRKEWVRERERLANERVREARALEHEVRSRIVRLEARLEILRASTADAGTAEDAPR